MAIFCLAYFPILLRRDRPSPFQAAKKNQMIPRKTKKKGLDFLGILWPNWDFSKGYSESK
jgi:hypothetical protein